MLYEIQYCQQQNALCDFTNACTLYTLNSLLLHVTNLQDQYEVKSQRSSN